MGVSETILAASIGAGATVATAVVQLMISLRAQSKADFRPKRQSTLRSMIAVVVLMIASGFSGYLYAEYRNASATQDLRAMRDEFNARLSMLTATTERLAEARSSADSKLPSQVIDSTFKKVERSIASTSESRSKIIQSTVYVPGCVGECTEATAKVVPVCGSAPKTAQVEQIDLYVADAGLANDAATASVQTFEHIEADHEINGIKFVGTPAISREHDDAALCVEFKQWSAQAHFARIALRVRESNEANAMSPASAEILSAHGTNSDAGSTAALQN